MNLYVIGYYDAPARDCPATLPLVIHTSHITHMKIENAEECALQCARKYMRQITNDATTKEMSVVIDEAPDTVSKPGYHLYWLPSMYTEAHRVLGMYYARPKQGWLGSVYAGKLRPVRFYFVNTLPETAYHHLVNGKPNDASDDSSTDNSIDETPTAPEKACWCGRQSVHFHQDPYHSAASMRRRRARPSARTTHNP